MMREAVYLSRVRYDSIHGLHLSFVAGPLRRASLTRGAAVLGRRCVAAMSPVALLLAAAKDSNAPAGIAALHISRLGHQRLSLRHI